jgi:lysocardiolipin and lysophospholipid acyltransferase
MKKYIVYTNVHSVHATQFIGVPFYFLNKDYYYAWMAKTKEFFGVICNSLTYLFAPTKIIVSGDASIRGQLRLTKDGRLETDFPERLVMICNHQVGVS